jgi:hypothetical protein
VALQISGHKIETRGVQVKAPAGTGDRPAAVQPSQPIHDPGNIFDDGQITARQFTHPADPGLAVVDGLEIIEP